jgi:signal transduction histidine kinase
MTWNEMLSRVTKPQRHQGEKRRVGALRRSSNLNATNRPLRSGLQTLSFSSRPIAEAKRPAATLSEACATIGDDPTAAALDRDALLARIRRLRRENESLRAELHRRSNSDRAPFYSSAHDLKTPLCTLETVVDALNQSLVHEGASEESRNLARLVELSSRRMRSLVDDILDLGRVGSNEDQHELVDLGQLVAAAIERHSSDIEEKQIVVRVAAPLPVVRGPRSDLRAVITNIVENAVKYTPHGRSQTITIGADRSQAAPTIWVSDTGCGFDPQKIDDAFQAYVRCNAEVDGTGLGLAIVKKAVDGWGGKVWIDTERGVGTTVHFTAPGGSSHAGARSGSLWSARQEDLR